MEGEKRRRQRETEGREGRGGERKRGESLFFGEKWKFNQIDQYFYNVEFGNIYITILNLIISSFICPLILIAENALYVSIVYSLE